MLIQYKWISIKYIYELIGWIAPALAMICGFGSLVCKQPAKEKFAKMCCCLYWWCFKVLRLNWQTMVFRFPNIHLQHHTKDTHLGISPIEWIWVEFRVVFRIILLILFWNQQNMVCHKSRELWLAVFVSRKCLSIPLLIYILKKWFVFISELGCNDLHCQS